jgi:hypothetical protein
LRNSELKVLTAFYHPVDDRAEMWVRVLAGAMIAIGLLGTVVSLWALSSH